MKPVGSTSKMWSLCNCGGRMLEESLNFNRTAANNDMILVNIFIQNSLWNIKFILILFNSISVRSTFDVRLVT